MKILDKIGSWIDKLDAKIFGKENYQPLAGQGFVAALKTAVGVGIVLFLVQMFTTGRTLENWTAGIGAACILIALSLIHILVPGTTYYYCTYASSGRSIAKGEVKTFTTIANSAPLFNSLVLEAVEMCIRDRKWIIITTFSFLIQSFIFYAGVVGQIETMCGDVEYEWRFFPVG